MYKKIVSIVLTLTLIFGMVPAGFAQETPSGAMTKPSKALELLETQANGLYEDTDRVTVLVEINDAFMKQHYGLENQAPPRFKTEEGLAKQIQYAKQAQGILEKALQKQEVTYQKKESYDVVFTGLALKTTMGEAKKIAQMPLVSAVELSTLRKAPVMTKVRRYRSLDDSSNQMIRAQQAWLKHYTGKGQVVAIIDSGFDPSNPSFQNIDLNTAKYGSNEAIQGRINQVHASPGKFFSGKFPFGFNYFTKGSNLVENNPISHGQHVAGIVAANGNGLQGVAPDAQILAMRVFGEGGLFGGGTAPEFYNKAIDDAVKLGADSINMSLGAPSGSEKRVDPVTIKAIKAAQKAGIVVSIAAGNDGFFGNGEIEGPLAKNPDYGTVSDPAIVFESLAVASVENNTTATKSMLVDGDTEKKIAFAESSNDDGTKIPTLTTSYVGVVAVGYGYDKDYPKASLEGKYALIKRGEEEGAQPFRFDEKISIAASHGASGAIVYNNHPGDEIMAMGLQSSRIPSAFISGDSGEYLKAHPDYKIKFDDHYVFSTNPKKGQMSDFSSWGFTPEGQIKPDITAPGGRIFSTISGTGYGPLDGTSMAAPQVSGGIAIVKQRVEKDFPNILGQKKHQLIKNLLMSTAVPHQDPENGNLTSPRKQGAGVMDLERATTSNVVVWGTNQVSSLNLGNINENRIHLKGTLKNYGQEVETYTYQGLLTTDEVNAEKQDYLTQRPKKLGESEEKSITVNPGEEATFDLEMSYEGHEELLKTFANGYFLEGFVLFKNQDERKNLSLPFVGFRGSYTDLPVFEDGIYDLVAQGKRPMYFGASNEIATFTHLKAEANGRYVVLGEQPESTLEAPVFDARKIAFSPNDDGQAEKAYFAATFLRNYANVSMKIYRADDQQRQVPIYSLRDDEPGRKNSKMPMFGPASLVTQKYNWFWDGKDSEQVKQPDGHYVMVIGATADNEANKMFTREFPIILDTQYPKLVKASYDQEKGLIYLQKIIEEGSGLRHVFAKFGSEIYSSDKTFKTVQLPKNKDLKGGVLTLVDNAFNEYIIPLEKAVALTGNERSVMVVPKLSGGHMTDEDYAWEVYDQNNTKMNPYNLKPGKYRLKVTHVNPEVELVGADTIPFEIGENDFTKIVELKFKSKILRNVSVSVSSDFLLDYKLFLRDTQTGEDFALPKNTSTAHAGKLPVGTYLIVLKDIQPKNPKLRYHVIFPMGQEVKITENQILGATGMVNLVEARDDIKNVKVKLQRNGCDKSVKVVFAGKDADLSQASVIIPASEKVGLIDLDNIPYDVIATSVENDDWRGELTYEPSGRGPWALTLEMKSIRPEDKLDKSRLIEKIKEAEALNREDFEEESYQYLEIVLLAAKKGMNMPNLTQKMIDDYTHNLILGIERLKPKDFSKHPTYKEDLKKLIAEARALKQGEHSGVEWDGLLISIADGQAVVDREDAIQEEVSQAMIALKDAMKPWHDEKDTSETSIQTEALEEAISVAKKLVQEGHSEEEWAQLEATISEAEKVLEAKENQAKVDAVTQKLETLIENWEKTSKPQGLDRSALEHLIAEAEERAEAKADENAKKAFKKALKKAKARFADEHLDAEALEQAITELKEALAAWDEAVEKATVRERLEKLVEKAKGLEQGQAKDELWQAFAEALAAGEKALQEETLEKAEAEQLIERLTAALDAVKKDQEKGLDYSALVQLLKEAKAEQAEDLRLASWQALQDSIEEGEQLLAKAEATQEQVNLLCETLKENLKNWQVAKENALSLSQVLAKGEALLAQESLLEEASGERLKAALAAAKAEQEGTADAQQAAAEQLLEVLQAVKMKAESPVTYWFAKAGSRLAEVKAEAKGEGFDFTQERPSLAILPLSPERLAEAREALNPAQQALKGYEISLTQNGEPVHSTGTFSVSLPYDGKFVPERIHLYHEENGNFVEVPVEVNTAEKTLNFTVTHFSAFVMTGDLLPVDIKVPEKVDTEKPEPKEEPKQEEKEKVEPKRSSARSSRSSSGGGGGGSRRAPVIKIEKPKGETATSTAPIVSPSPFISSHFINGYQDGTFRPTIALKRAEVAQMLYQMMGAPKATMMAEFKDVAPDSWYSAAVYSLAERQVISGDEHGDFHGERAITRAEFVKMVVTLANLEGQGQSFKDVPKNHWAAQYIAAAAQHQIISGIGEGKFAPDQALTRAEAVTILNRLLKHYGVQPLQGMQKNFKDVSPDYWAYQDIVQAAM